MAAVNTTKGYVEEDTLSRTVGFEDRPDEMVVWVEWRLDGELVRRDAHVILKKLVDAAEAVNGGL
jgi:hypothetical protein